MGSKQSTAAAPPSSPPPEAIAMDIITGGWKAQALFTFVNSGLADVMPDSKSKNFAKPEDLAEKADLNPNAVFRLLRYLSTIGVCIEHEDGGLYKNGPVGDVCTKSCPTSAAGKILLEGSEVHTNIWTNMSTFMKTGKRVIKDATGHDEYWAMCKATPEHLKVFQEAMTSYTMDEVTMMKIPSLSPTFDLSSFETVCDLGAAEGTLAKALNERFADCKYIIADLPEAVGLIDAKSLPSNFEVKGCDFLNKTTIPKADAYLLKHIIHDWDDGEAIIILKNIKFVNPDAKVFVMEFGPMPGPNVPHLCKLLDLHMALTLNGHERSQAEYDALYDQAGYKMDESHLLAGGNFPLYIQEISSTTN